MALEMGLEAVGAVFVASIVGSLHCAAMCGGLVGALGAGATRTGWTRLELGFHAGRGFAYAAIGASAGALGSAVNLAGQHAGLVDAAGLVAGALVLAAGLRGLLVTLGTGVPSFGGNTRIQSWLGRHLAGTRAGGPTVRATVLGVSAALLPCGWLYGFVFAAAGTGRPLWGAAVLLSFWLGTLPALLGVGALVRRLSVSLGRHVAFVSALVLVLLGLGTILHRVNIPAEAFSRIQSANAAAGDPARLPCHSHEAP